MLAPSRRGGYVATATPRPATPTYIRTDSLRAVFECVRDSVDLPDDLAADVSRCIDALSGPAFLTSGEAARILGYSSINSVKSLAANGFLMGAVRSRTGHWRLPLDSVLAAREFNRGGMTLPPATGNAFEGDEPDV